MARGLLAAVCRDRRGNVISGALVTVLNSDGDVASAYTDRDGATLTDNPKLTDANGYAGFFVADGEYTWTATKAGRTIGPFPFTVGGTPGEPGPAGASFEYSWSTPLTTIVIDHNLGYRPAVGAVIDSSGKEVQVGRDHPTVNRTILTTLSPFSGKVRLL